MSSHPPSSYSIVVSASPEETWNALIAGTAGWYFDTTIESTWAPGEIVTNYGRDGETHITGTVLAFEPPTRLATTFRPVWTEIVRGAPETDVEWTLASMGPLTRVTLIHRGLPEGFPAAQLFAEGWVYLLSNLKTVLETGKAFPS